MAASAQWMAPFVACYPSFLAAAMAPLSSKPVTVTENPRCPFCGEAMQAGAVLGDRYSLKWQPNNREMMLGIWSTGHTIGKQTWLGRPRAYGHRCATCKKIILEERSSTSMTSLRSASSRCPARVARLEPNEPFASGPAVTLHPRLSNDRVAGAGSRLRASSPPGPCIATVRRDRCADS